MIAEGDKVFAKCKATADGMETIFGHYFEIKDGKIKETQAWNIKEWSYISNVGANSGPII